MRRAGPLCLLALVPAAVFAAGCGGGEATTPSVGAIAAPKPSSPSFRYVPDTDVDRIVANSFRIGLRRLAGMQQPFDGADQGQALPQGQLQHVSCAQAGPRPTARETWMWRCQMGWTTTMGRPQRTRYRVYLFPTGCLTATAVPARSQIRDATAGTIAEDPLNALYTAQKGC